VDVIVVLGQSNAAGCGVGWTLSDAFPRLGVWELRPLRGRRRLVPAVDRPGRYGRTKSGCISFDRTFAILYRGATGRQVTVVNASVGQAGFVPDAGQTWDPADTTAPRNLYREAVTTIREALARLDGNFIAVLWHQGEHDVGKLSEAEYAARLDAVIVGLRGEFGSTPFLVGQMVPEWIASKGEAGAAIDAAHRHTPDRQPATAFVETPLKSHNLDGIHINAPGQRELGRRYFAAWQSLTDDAGVSGLELGVQRRQRGIVKSRRVRDDIANR
jgi:hypothetical protein